VTSGRALAGLCRVTVAAPASRIDLALPSDLPIAAMLANLVELAGVATPDGGSSHGGWCLSRPAGAELNPARTLDALGVLDGDILHLRPRSLDPPAPVFDDVIDAVASSARADIRGWRPDHARRLASVACVALATTAAAVLLRLGPSDGAAAVGAVAAILFVGVAALFARSYRESMVGVALAAGAWPLAFAAGVLSVPGDEPRTRLLVGGACWLTAVALGAAAAARGAAVFAAGAVAATLTGGAALFAVLVAHPASGIAAGTLCLAVALTPVLPRLAARLSRLPLPVLPSRSDDLAWVDEQPDLTLLQSHTKLGRNLFLGMLAGDMATAGGCCVVLAAAGTPAALILTGLGLLVLLLPVRRVDDLAQRSIRIVAVMSAAVAGATTLASLHPDVARTWLIGLLLASGLFVAGLGAAAGRARVAPTTRRAVDLVETMAVIALLPVAAAVMQVFSTVRHL
jgi:type VII secretion integral membrane protein EccD